MSKPKGRQVSKILYSHWCSYCECQRLGYYNMLDYESWAGLTFLNKDEWFEIINNYNYYLEKFGNV